MTWYPMGRKKRNGRSKITLIEFVKLWGEM